MNNTHWIEDAQLLVRRYAEAAAEHGRATEAGNSRNANKQHDIISEIYRELRRRGEPDVLELLSLLSDPDRSVRGWASAHALEFAPDQGEPVLAELAGGGDIQAFTAQITLEQWRKGALRFS